MLIANQGQGALGLALARLLAYGVYAVCYYVWRRDEIQQVRGVAFRLTLDDRAKS